MYRLSVARASSSLRPGLRLLLPATCPLSSTPTIQQQPREASSGAAPPASTFTTLVEMQEK